MSQTEPGPDTGRSPRPRRVLCVDDDVPFLETVEAYLRREAPEIRVLTTASPAEGIDIVGEGVDCIVSDYEMPDCDGLEFLRAVRRVDTSVPFLLFTGRGSEEIAARAISTGVTDYLQKSIGTEQYTLLANRVSNLVEKHDAERQLAETAQRYELVGRASADAFWDWDRETDSVWRSDGFATTFGYDPDAVGDDRSWWRTRIHPDDRTRVEASFEAFLDAGDHRYEDRYRFERVDGTYAHIVDRAYAISDDHLGNRGGREDVVETEDGPTPDSECGAVDTGTASTRRQSRPNRVVGAITDVSVLVEREREVERSQRRYRTLVESFPNVGVFLFDSELRFTVAGGEMLAYHGFAPDDFVGYGVEEVLRPEIADKQLPRYRKTLDGERQHWSETFEGREYVVNTVPVRDESERVFAGMLVALDVTERRETESVLRRQNERLERFASVLSHDLRNPLTVATARLALAREECDSPQLDSVKSAHDRMNELLVNVLELTRSGNVVDLASVDLETVARIHWDHVDTGAATLEIESTGEFRADRSRLGQLLENAFANAITHTRPDVTVRVGVLDDDSTAVRGFFIEDDGPGIPSDQRESVFEVGYSTQSRGGGFGLSIIADVATGHGWDTALTEAASGGVRLEFEGVEPV